VLKLPPCGRSLLAQHHDVVIIDNLATGQSVTPSTIPATATPPLCSSHADLLREY
jgi:hypothetical protein